LDAAWQPRGRRPQQQQPSRWWRHSGREGRAERGGGERRKGGSPQQQQDEQFSRSGFDSEPDWGSETLRAVRSTNVDIYICIYIYIYIIWKQEKLLTNRYIMSSFEALHCTTLTFSTKKFLKYICIYIY